MGSCKTSFSLLRTAIKCSKLLNPKEVNNSTCHKLLLNQFLYTNTYLGKHVSFNLSDIGEGIREVIVKEWYVKVGDKVKQFENICEVQSDKASATITSRYDGTISKLHYKVDEIAAVGRPLVDIDTENDFESTEHDTTSPTLPEKSTEENSSVCNEKPAQEKDEIIEPHGTVLNKKDILCLPSVRRLAKQYNIDLEKVTGSGRNGRINREDVLKYSEIKENLTSLEDIFIERIEPVTGFNKAMVKSMTASLKMPLLTYSDEISVKKLTALRNTLKATPELSGVSISYMPFFIKAISNSLLQYPIINSHYDEEKESIVYKRPHNVGVAMDSKQGLATPVIKNVERLSIVEIAKELMRLIECGRKGSFSVQDLSHISILISNIGSIGGTYVRPIPVSQTSTIIGLGAIQVLPRFDSSMNCVPDEILAISGSADHRIIDGATIARFTNVIKTQIQNPHTLLLKLH